MNGDQGYRSFFYTSRDGLRLHAAVYGEPRAGALPAICLAGLTRNARDFHELALRLSRDTPTPRQVIAFDYRGRGRSDRDPDWRNYDPIVEAGDVADGLAALGVEHGAFIGTSRGGLIIFALAAMRPGLLAAAILNDIGPVVEGAGLAQIRAYLERAPKPGTMTQAVAIQKATQAASFPALSDTDWERIAHAFFHEDKGRVVPDFDAAILKTMKSINLSRPLPVLWPQFLGLGNIPVLAIRGENSPLLSAETLQEMARRHPDIRTITARGQGHAPFLEIGGLPRQIADFLDHADRRARLPAPRAA